MKLEKHKTKTTCCPNC